MMRLSWPFVEESFERTFYGGAMFSIRGGMKTGVATLALCTFMHCARNDGRSTAADERAIGGRPSTGGSLVQSVAEGKSRAFAIDRRTYETVENRRLPIGVFDSGIGGLTVLNAILRLDEFDNRTHEPHPDGTPDFQNERFIYFGDQANMPYGNYPAAGKEDFLKELIVEDALFLLGRRYWASADAKAPAMDKPPVKSVVIACNTATAYGLDAVRAAFEAWKVPVILIGVVEAGARGAVLARSQAHESGAVAVPL